MNIQEVLSNPLETPIPSNEEEQHMVCNELVGKINQENADKILQYLIRIPPKLVFTHLRKEYSKREQEIRSTGEKFKRALPEVRGSKVYIDWFAKEIKPLLDIDMEFFDR